jgi:hypothetical protein
VPALSVQPAAVPGYRYCTPHISWNVSSIVWVMLEAITDADESGSHVEEIALEM